MIKGELIDPSILYTCLMMSSHLKEYTKLNELRYPYSLVKNIDVNINIMGCKFNLTFTDSSNIKLSTGSSINIESKCCSIVLIKKLDYGANINVVVKLINLILYEYENYKSTYKDLYDTIRGYEYRISHSSSYMINVNVPSKLGSVKLRHSKNARYTKLITEEEYNNYLLDGDKVLREYDGNYYLYTGTETNIKFFERVSSKLGVVLQPSARVNDNKRARKTLYVTYNTVIEYGSSYELDSKLAVYFETHLFDFSRILVISAGMPWNNLNVGLSALNLCLEKIINININKDLLRRYISRDTQDQMLITVLQDNIIYKIEEIIDDFFDEKSFFDIKSYYRILEELFDINIYIINLTNTNVEISLSDNRSDPYIWEHNYTRKNIVLVINSIATYIQDIGYHICALNVDNSYIFDSDHPIMSQLIKDKTRLSTKPTVGNNNQMFDKITPSYQYVNEYGITIYKGYTLENITIPKDILDPDIYLIHNTTKSLYTDNTKSDNTKSDNTKSDNTKSDNSIVYEDIKQSIVNNKVLWIGCTAPATLISTVSTIRNDLLDHCSFTELMNILGVDIVSADIRLMSKGYKLFGFFTSIGYCPLEVCDPCDICTYLKVEMYNGEDEDRHNDLIDYYNSMNELKDVMKTNKAAMKFLSALTLTKTNRRNNKYTESNIIRNIFGVKEIVL